MSSAALLEKLLLFKNDDYALSLCFHHLLATWAAFMEGAERQKFQTLSYILLHSECNSAASPVNSMH